MDRDTAVEIKHGRLGQQRFRQSPQRILCFCSYKIQENFYTTHIFLLWLKGGIGRRVSEQETFGLNLVYRHVERQGSWMKLGFWAWHLLSVSSMTLLCLYYDNDDYSCHYSQDVHHHYPLHRSFDDQPSILPFSSQQQLPSSKILNHDSQSSG